MRAIQKQSEPWSLTEHRASGNPDFVPDYDGYQHKDDLRISLVAEQGAICCYCMQRIQPTVEGMKIEHWHCQTRYAAEQLDYGNLLGACLGGQGKPPKLQHCDTKKGDQDLALNPAKSSHRIETSIKYLSDGSITSSNPVLNEQLTSVLNLNLSSLKRNRKAAVDALQASLRGRGTLSKAALRREAAAWSTATDGRLKEYCQVVLYWLQKRIARA